MPVSRNRSVMSFKRHCTSLRRYSLSPLRYSFRVMVTWLNSVGRMFLVLSKLSDTSARFPGFRLAVPLNITFSIFSDRSMRVLCSPRTQRMASTTLDFPRSEEHTSELQSRENLVCRLLLE